MPNTDIALDPETLHPQHSHLGFPVVGLGASAGGIGALRRFFENLPSDTGMAFVVVIHLSPTHESTLAQILAGVTRMRVTEVTEAAAIEANCVYVISPSKDLLMSDGSLSVRPLSRPEGRHTAIDLFFRSLAEAHRERSVGIVLSGTGADGTQGLKRLKERGGVTLAQSPEDAEFDGMPLNALATGLVDVVLPVVELPQKLLDLWANARHMELPAPPSDLEVDTTPPESAQMAEEALYSIKAVLRERTGNDFSHYKRATVLRRLERRMQVHAVPNLLAYRRLLETTPQETNELLQDMLISVTNFFRDREAFDALERQLIAAREKQPREQQFRAWVAGCATGEEAYSVAILLAELQDANGEALPAQVFGSDIDQRAIDAARRGYFPESIATDVSPMRLRQHFTREGDGYRISKRVRDAILFSLHNVLRDPPFTRVDLVCCRNLLIYLDREAQKKALETFHFALNPGGLLFLGNSESADAAEGLFEVIDKKQRIYCAVANRRSVRALPTTPPIYVPPAAQPRRELPPPAPLQDLHERTVARFGPPTVLIDADHTVLHVSENAAHLLRFSAGAPSAKLLDLVRPELRIELRTALFAAAQTARSVEARRTRFMLNGTPCFVAISVRPINEENAKGLSLITFDQTEATMVDDDDAEAGVSDRPMLEALEAELRQLKASLNDTLGESAASTQELRASNEELQTINEELRSATEELETSREELQSVNEELTIVNSELQAKIQETGKVNDDLQNLVSSIQIGTVFVDLQMRIKRFTPHAAKLFNLIGSDVGRSLLDITHRLRYPELEHDLQATFDTLTTAEREVRSHDGEWFLVRAQPFRTRDQRIDGAVLNFVDVTRRREAEDELRQSEQRLRLFAASMHAYAIITMDTRGLITGWSAGAVKLFGYAEHQAVGQPADLIFTPADQASSVAAHEMRQARENGRADDDRWMQRQNGQVFFCSGIMTPMVDNGQLVGYAKICRDFTQSRLVEAQRHASLTAEQRARVRLEETSVLKDEFIAVMSHELRNPLNIVQLHVAMLRQSNAARSDALVTRSANMIAGAVQSQVQIIDDLLDMSRLRTRKLALQLGPVDFSDVVTQIVEALRGDAAAKQQTLAFEPGGPVMLRADRVRVEQIVWNLLTNALKFTPAGGTVRVTLAQAGAAAKLTVADNGDGLSAHDIDGIFDMYRQADAATTTRGGMGIGLALVKQLAELHGGRVAAESPGRGQGSTFCVWLPTESAAPAEAPEQQSAGGSLQGRSILLVDDDPESLEGLATVLGLAGAQVTTARDAESALAQVDYADFDVVLSDLSMPGKDGYWLIEQLRARPRSAGLHVIAVSGMARERDRTRALHAGFDAHVSKPVSISLLETEIRRRAATR